MSKSLLAESADRGFRIQGILMMGLFLVLLSMVPCKAQTGFSIEAENADVIYRSNVDSNHPGFSGRGFINFLNENGSSIEWLIDLPGEGNYRIDVFFANGGTSRTMDIFVNGALAYDDFSFPSTSTWPNWQILGFDVRFSRGVNSLKLVSSNPEGGPNIDRIFITSSEVNLNVSPVARNDSVTLSPYQQALLSPLDNDYDLNGDELSIAWFSEPEKGILSLSQSNQSFVYKPLPDFTGKVGFAYAVTDGVHSDTAEVLIVIENIDWSVAMAEMIIKTKTPASVGAWNYTVGLLLEGILRVYKRTGNLEYLNFVKDWGMLHISEAGKIDVDLISLDNMMPGFMILHLYMETGIERFKLAADNIFGDFNTYPRTSDGGFWHKKNLNNELWLDGLYMGMPFLATYATMFGGSTDAYAEVVRQFTVYLGHLMNAETQIPVHGYDEDGSAGWSRNALKRSPYHWGRSIGWVVMALSELLDIIPADYPQRQVLTDYYRQILLGLVVYQHPETGLWYQVVDHPDDAGNWQETSCSMMFTLALKRAVDTGIVDSSVIDCVNRGYSGVLSKISRIPGGMVFLTDICEGTGVSSDINFYFTRAKNTNDNHGLGTFMIMNEMVVYNNLPWRNLPSALNAGGVKNQEYPILFPNPCTDQISVDLTGFSGEVDITIYGLPGCNKVHQSIRQNRITPTIPVGHFPPGVYLCQIRSKDLMKTVTFIKKY